MTRPNLRALRIRTPDLDSQPDQGHGSVTVDMHHHDADAVAEWFTLAELFAERRYVAGLLGRLHSDLTYSDLFTHCRYCSVTSGCLFEPTADLGDAPWLEMVVETEQVEAARLEVSDRLELLIAGESTVPSAAREMSWQVSS